MTDWGALPEAVRSRLRQLEWDNGLNLRDRLLGKRVFPIRVSLKPPNGRQALDAMTHFQDYMAAWRDWPGPGRVEHEVAELQQVGRHQLPTALVLDKFDELAGFLGPRALQRQRHWESVFEPFFKVDRGLYPSLIRNLPSMELLSCDDATQIAMVLSQMKPGLGRDRYLRALPLNGVDTKFVEQNFGLLTQLVDGLYEGAVSRAGGLEAWLDCKATPRDWLIARALCPQCRVELGGFDLMQLSTSSLLTTALPGRRILVVENIAAGFALPAMASTVVVFGGGANVAWTKAPWLADRQIGYWGDIDTWGLHILAAVRENQPSVQTLLMDHETIEAHRTRVVSTKESNAAIPTNLTIDEVDLYQCLLSNRYGGNCLEQERISSDFLSIALDRWSSV